MYWTYIDPSSNISFQRKTNYVTLQTAQTHLLRNVLEMFAAGLSSSDGGRLCAERNRLELYLLSLPCLAIELCFIRGIKLRFVDVFEIVTGTGESWLFSSTGEAIECSRWWTKGTAGRCCAIMEI